MRIEFSILKQIDKAFGPMEVGSVFSNPMGSISSITLRFGYWKQVDLEKLNSLLPNHMQASENLVDEDDECGELWNYLIIKK